MRSVRDAAIAGLLRLGARGEAEAREAVPYFARLLNDPDTEFRVQARFGLALFCPQALEFDSNIHRWTDEWIETKPPVLFGADMRTRLIGIAVDRGLFDRYPQGAVVGTADSGATRPGGNVNPERDTRTGLRELQSGV